MHQMQMSFCGISPSRVSPIRAYLRTHLTFQVSQRGVVFFRKQDNLTNDLQKQLIQRLGELTGKPETSKLHIHPILNSERELGGSDPEISTISSVQDGKLYVKTPYDQSKKQQRSAQWHSDIAFEPVPADYTSLRLTQLPKTGGGMFVQPVTLLQRPLTNPQIRCGLQDTRSMTRSVNRISAFWRH